MKPRKTLRSFVAASLLWLVCVPSLAADVESCLGNALTTKEMTACISKATDEANGDLVQTLNTLRSERSSGDRRLLRDAQRAWETYREAHCRAVESLYAGGSMGRMQRIGCIGDLARKRVAEIHNDYDDVLSKHQVKPEQK